MSKLVITAKQTPIANKFLDAAKISSKTANDFMWDKDISKAIEATKVQLRSLEAIRPAIRFDSKVNSL